LEYGRLLPQSGELIYCADDPGASEVALLLQKEKPAISLIPYGFSASGDFGIESYEVRNEKIVMRIRSFPGDLEIPVPGRHTALNAAAAIALSSSLIKKEFGDPGWSGERRAGIQKALSEFKGSKRRSEIIGEAGGILFMDDYGHHPTAIRTTLEGLKEFYPKRRLVLSFMSHTYTRTASLFDEFAASVEKADVVLFHKIYSSAREAYSGGVTGRSLYERALALNPGKPCYYAEEAEDGAELMFDVLKPGDLFISMGAGDNWKLGKKLYDHYKAKG
jgi:UDP-N-acetylmuramate--alanine ligase